MSPSSAILEINLVYLIEFEVLLYKKKQNKKTKKNQQKCQESHFHLKMPCFKNFKKVKRRTFWDDHEIPVRNLDIPDLESDNFQSGLEII
jgi:hypothetical protein